MEEGEKEEIDIQSCFVPHITLLGLFFFCVIMIDLLGTRRCTDGYVKGFVLKIRVLR